MAEVVDDTVATPEGGAEPDNGPQNPFSSSTQHQAEQQASIQVAVSVVHIRSHSFHVLVYVLPCEPFLAFNWKSTL
jgi:hypothetical protein